MRFRKIKDVLDWTRTFHSTLADDYDKLAEGHERERVGILLAYLAEHERVLGAALQHYEDDEHPSLLETGYAPDVELPEDLNALCDTLDRLDTAGVLAMAIRFHDLLTGLYRKLSENAPSSQIKDLFENIASQEEHEKLRAVRDAGRLEDM